MALRAEVEEQIGQWRGYLQHHRAIAVADLDELEDHLRAQIDDLRSAGLADDEAFLVAIRRMGGSDAISREFAREHTERMWKQLTATAEDTPPDRREPAVAVGLGAGAGVCVTLLILVFSWGGPLGSAAADHALFRILPLVVLAFLGAYFAWKRRPAPRAIAALAIAFTLLAAAEVFTPFGADAGATHLLAVIHLPVAAWGLVGLAYAGGRWRDHTARMDFVRFTGEFVVYFVLLALGGGLLIGLTSAVLSLAGTDPTTPIEWILRLCIPGAVLVAAWLVEAKQNVIENIVPVLTRVFTPIATLALLWMLVALATAGPLAAVDRELLILMDGVLILVLALTLYTISAREALAPAGAFDGLQLGMLVTAIAVDLIALTAMITRIAEFGVSANKTAALGLNLLLLVHLTWQAWLTLRFLRRRTGFAALERWQTSFLPLYPLWAAVVALAFPFLFGFA
ncbi:permease prefix domain 1-containing protein [Microbacterium sp. Marseille-Q6965]|uniref:permease prefix domain 1-containing protein n=1 Tax=Microbacterium sp. Marseille-Q6965 TaxID=2965072 RepID=UPI0021B75AF6|nr:permease prefix domain 1-containing protein [Microbacterium sp. Marseille-Q6965]